MQKITPCKVILSPLAKEQIKLVPEHIGKKAQYWTAAVEQHGIWTVRKVPGYHDEPLRGKRKGQRSIRLNKAYRLIYKENDTGKFFIINVVEVNKHDY